MLADGTGLAGVLFDMDGLLVDTEPLWMRAEERVVADLGGSGWGPDDQRAILGLALPQAAAYMRRFTGTSVPVDEVGRRVVAGFLDEVRAGGEIVLQPGAAALVAEVAAEGLPFALVSASVRSIMEVIAGRLADEGLPAFPVTVAGDEVARGKPDPQPYLHAAGLLDVPIERCVVLEDSVNGVQAGWSAGATVVAVEGLVRHEPRPRVVVRQSLDGLDVAALRELVATSASPPSPPS
ncbi:MAG: HAD family phosphatase [Candidatus Nanopelagicales bacterium]|jgi:HAD superfamily hydrolase (TIGR01509 family)|nr:HAD family phosphatase [Candidatus Nanopelagicales bacterium]